jgi:hypothetical protein
MKLKNARRYRTSPPHGNDPPDIISGFAGKN